MENKQTVDEQSISKKGRLSTEKINLGSFSADKFTNDLQALEEAEKNSTQKEVSNVENVDNGPTQEMLALKLSNPFRGY